MDPCLNIWPDSGVCGQIQKITQKLNRKREESFSELSAAYIRCGHGKSSENSLFPLFPMGNMKIFLRKLIFSPNSRFHPGILA